jgi:hypothetical protein
MPCILPPLKVPTIAAAWGQHGINEVLDMLGHGLASDVAPHLYFLSDIFGNVVRPMLQRVEDDANRIIELPGHKIVDDDFEVGPLDLGFAVNWRS